eukprot:4645481-Pyramimonas_sp.AAC.1
MATAAPPTMPMKIMTTRATTSTMPMVSTFGMTTRGTESAPCSFRAGYNVRVPVDRFSSRRWCPSPR